jgi:pimeloyl-ACP methyl ester carboxylesterase
MYPRISIFPGKSSACRGAGQTRFTQLTYYNALDKGGHFPAFEQPHAFVDEVRAAFRTMR